MSSNKKIFRNIIATLLGEGVGALLNIYVIVLIARTLGPESFGDFAFILAFVGLLQLVTDMGVTNLLVREIAQKAEQYKHFFGNVRLLAWAVTLVATAPTAVVCLLILEDRDFGMSLFIMTVAALIVFHSVIYGALFRAFERMEFNAAIFVIHKVILLALTLYWRDHDPSILALCGYYLLANVCQFLLFYACSLAVFKRIPWRFDPGLWKYVLFESVPIGLSMMCRRATLHVDTLILKAMAAPLALGLFNAAYRVIQIIEMLPFTLSIPIYPKLARLALGDKAEFSRFLNQVLKFYAILSLPIVAYVFVFAEDIIGLMYTPEFASSANILQALAVAIFFIFPSSIMIYVYSAMGRQRLFTLISLATLATNAILDILLIPHLHAFGAAVGTVTAEALFIAGSLWFLYRQSVPVQWVRMSYKPLLAALLAGYAVNAAFASPGLLQFILASLLFAVAYLILILVSKTLDQRELAFLAALIKRRPVGKGVQ
ncbi:flippase [Hahella sp. HN01]|uniref:flippase n=1 Tax=unclassified Hahella TaxID=2624107 RepID=UPI001C1E97E0|nr:flippase [Hahella sp. HN01]MBU6952879.1 flippase [Hahella sp. HN01]